LKTELTKEECKQLVMKVAVAVSPLLVEKKSDSMSAAKHIALYATDIADAVESILKKGY